MFERRLKILLAFLLLVTGALVLRAAQLQVFQGEQWRQRAAEMMKRPQFVETERGAIVDNRGRELALDVACIDACVDYRVIIREPDPTWMRNQARARLRRRIPEVYLKSTRDRQEEMVREEIARVREEIHEMWRVLAEVSGKSMEEIDRIRTDIIRRVEMRRRYLWYTNYENAVRDHEDRQASRAWYRQWLMLDDSENAPRLDQFEMSVREQEDAHVILRAITPEMNIRLGKHIEKYPGLKLRTSTHRYYPYGQVACHILGRLGRVTAEDVANDPHFDDELRKYWPNDLIGRSGLESMCDSVLRGARGRVVRYVTEEQAVEDTAPIRGETVQTTIDIELQGVIESLFRRARIEYKGEVGTEVRHGAAIVIDVPTSEVRAMVSYPTFDLNTINDRYYELMSDDINRPLMNRATLAQYEPGSTIKPVVGLAAITAHYMDAHDTIECTGDLYINGRKMPHGRCWTVKVARNAGFGIPHNHHAFPIPHPTGFLTFTDALERSCNIFFEQLADRMKIAGLSEWYDRFGLGRATGVGLPEVGGRIPSDYRGNNRAATAWFAGIGQGQILATPLQMANVAATIARDGVWMRPRLLPRGHDWASPPIDRRTGLPIPDEVDLNLSREALAMAKEGMIRVVNSSAGTIDRNLRKQIQRNDVVIAGKTGSAQVPKYRVPVKDAAGEPVLDENGRRVYRVLEPGTRAAPNPEAPWYKASGTNEDELTHAWFIGFAPAEKPQIAFAVLVEYGGSGGHAALSIASELIEACIDRGYLPLNR